MNSKFVSVKDFEEEACKILPRNALDYYRSGAGDQFSLKLNQSAFDRIRIRPRFLKDVSNRNLTIQALGESVTMPIGVSPSAMQRMAHSDGELANAKACEEMGTIYILSTLATSSIEEVAAAAPNCVKWFQLYIYKDRNITRDFLKRAEKADFKAIVLTIDAPTFGIRRADVRNKFVLPKHLRLANFDEYDEKSTKIRTAKDGSGLQEYVNNLFDDTITWDDVKWLRQVTKLPIILKGILTAEDAILARNIGVDGILVSNHGARQLDGTLASIEALPEIVRAVGNEVEIYFDGGIRDGIDVFKAIALGARMCFVGRPALWGLAVNGKDGVRSVLEILKTELDIALALSGCKTIADIKSDLVVHESYFSKL